MSPEQGLVAGPLLSVIIPTHNRTEMLCRALNGVLNQSFTDFEVVIVDDGSTDDSERRVDAYTDSRLRYFKHSESKGASAARNTGIRQARGKYVAFLDDDDEWLPHKLAKQVELLARADGSVGLVYCWMDYYADGVLVHEHHPVLRGYIFDQVLDRQRIGGCPTLVVRHEIVEEVGGFDETLPRGNDGDFIRRVCRKYAVDVVPEVLVHVHVGHNDRISLDTEQGLRHHIYSLESRLSRFAEELDNLPQAHVSILCQIATGYRQLDEDALAARSLLKAVRVSPLDCRPYTNGARLARGIIWDALVSLGRTVGGALPAPLRNLARTIWQRTRRLS
jgi:glycosyltransferase involved in cell wall biosynthesis